MSEWFVDVQSMIPVGQIGDRMLVAKIDNMRHTVAVMGPPTLTEYSMSDSIPADKVFMTGQSFGDFHKGDIDQFLQAVMDCGWSRGLRPKNFDPSAGELAAVNRHLEDMRKLASVLRVTCPEDAISDIGVDKDKKW